MDKLLSDCHNQLLEAACLRAPHVHYLRPTLLNLTCGQRLMYPDASGGHVYFPTSATLSVRCVLEDGATSEIACVGNEGALGAPPFSCSFLQPHIVTVSQAGAAYRLRGDALQGLAAGPLRSVIERNALTLAIQLVQNVVCSSHHTVEQRVAKWLLQAQDRCGCASLSTTQEALANVLGVRRESISQIVKRLAQLGCIVRQRGRIEVLSSSLLADRACECYRLACANLASQATDLAAIRRLAESRSTAHDPTPGLLCERRRPVDGQPPTWRSAYPDERSMSPSVNCTSARAMPQPDGAASRAPGSARSLPADVA